jgi:hypothetical protein
VSSRESVLLSGVGVNIVNDFGLAWEGRSSSRRCASLRVVESGSGQERHCTGCGAQIPPKRSSMDWSVISPITLAYYGGSRRSSSRWPRGRSNPGRGDAQDLAATAVILCHLDISERRRGATLARIRNG